MGKEFSTVKIIRGFHSEKLLRACIKLNDCLHLLQGTNPVPKAGSEQRRSAFLVTAKKAVYESSLKYCSGSKETSTGL